MPSVLIAGCGYVGIATAKFFHRHGWDVRGWTRSGDTADHEPSVRCSAVDLRNFEQVQRNSFRCDVVVHCASSQGGDVTEYRRLYLDGVANLVRCFPQSAILFTSSTRVYPQKDGSCVEEHSPAEPPSDQAKILVEAENVVLNAGGIVLRLGGIYGPGRSFFLQSILNGTASISANAERYVNQIHRDDAASAIFFLAIQETIAPPRIFNVVDDEPTVRAEILRWLAETLGKPLAPSTEATSARRRADSNKRVNNGKLRALGWSPQYPNFKEGLLRSVLPASALL
jgi:nucleoside-diphosphate-sugar epimerase